MADHVPTPGGFALPNGVPAAPSIPAPTIPAPVPAQAQPVAPIQFAGQVPGFVPPQPAPQPAPNPAQPQGMTAEQVQALIQNALAPQATTQPAQPAPAGNVPTWAEDLNGYDLSKIDDPIIRSMANVMQTVGQGLDMNRVLGRAIASGDVAQLDLPYLFEKGGANASNLAEIARGLVDAVNAKSEAVTRDVHSIAGGEAGWNQATAVFNQAAPVELRIAVANMLDSGNPAQIQAGAKLVSQFRQQSGLLPQQGAPLLNGTYQGAAGGQGLSADQFRKAIGELNIYAEDYADKREVLTNQRAVGKRLGY